MTVGVPMPATVIARLPDAPPQPAPVSTEVAPPTTVVEDVDLA
jgi:hypothetical protein